MVLQKIFNLPELLLGLQWPLNELFKLSDRIIVLYEGKIIKEFEINEANTNNVGLAMAGVIE